MIRVAVQNFSTVVSNPEVLAMVGAWRTQVMRDFYPAWGTYAFLYPLLKGETPAADMWTLGIFDTSDQAGALGYHDVTPAGRPLGKVFAKDTLAAGDAVSVTGSHELLEMLADPEIDLTVPDGNHPTRCYANEVGDAVEDDSLGYLIANVKVSDFVLPSYFSQSSVGPWDFQGKLTGPLPTLAVGGYMAYLEAGVWQQVFDKARSRKWAGKAGGSHRLERRKKGAHVTHSTFKVSR